MNFWFEPILKYIYYEYFKNEVTVKDFFVKFQEFLEYDSMPTIGILYNQLKNNYITRSYQLVVKSINKMCK